MSEVSTPPRRGNTTRPSSPILDRREEKTELGHLNTRLERYIESVRKLNSEKQELQTRLDLARNSAPPGTKRVFEDKLTGLRRDLEQTQSEKGILQLDIQKREAALAEAEQKNQKLEKELKAVRDKNVTLDQKVPALNEQIQFQIKSHEDEVKNLSVKLVEKNKELDLLRSKFNQDHHLQVNDKRKGWEAKAKAEKDTLERAHLDKHERATQDLEEKNTEATNIKIEINTLKAEASTISAKIEQAKRESQEIRNEVERTQKKNVEELAKLQAALDDRNAEIVKTKFAMQEKASQKIELENINISLNKEIEAYRRLLSGEEVRLGLKRKFEDDDEESDPRMRNTPGRTKVLLTEGSDENDKVRLKTVLAKSGIANIEDLNMEGKFIKVSNMTMSDIQLDGWWIQASAITGQKTAVKFHKQSVIPADGTIIVRVKVQEQGESEDTGALAFSQEMIGAGSNVILFNELDEIISQVDIVEAESDDDKEGTFERVCMVM